ncbi:MAG: hypothetical protein ABH919_00070 [bacterium]
MEKMVTEEKDSIKETVEEVVFLLYPRETRKIIKKLGEKIECQLRDEEEDFAERLKCLGFSADEEAKMIAAVFAPKRAMIAREITKDIVAEILRIDSSFPSVDIIGGVLSQFLAHKYQKDN